MQSYVADVGTERRPDGSYEHEVVVWTVPRQTGKTTGLRGIGTHRSFARGRDVFYTAQTGKHARARWLELVQLIQQAPAFGDTFDLTLRGGSECIDFRTGAGFHAFAPTEDSLHSYTPPCVMIDEAWKLAPGTGELIIGAAEPGQLTLVDSQIWIVSTAGTAASTFLHDWIDRAIGGEPRVAVFDWGARDDQDPYDLDDIAAFHPGIGFDFNGKTLRPEDVLKASSKLSRAEYERAYGNRRTVTASHLIPIETWVRLRAMSDETHEPPPGCTLTYDVGADREGSSLLATWLDDGVARVQVQATAPGVRWLTEAVVRYAGKLRPREIAAAENGPVLEVTAQVRARGIDVRTITEREFAASTGGLLTRIDEGTLRHDGNAEGTDALSRSVTGIVTRAGAVDGVAISRRHSVGDTSAAVAAAVGVHVATVQPETKPFTVFAS
jgi:hypothetical protein